MAGGPLRRAPGPLERKANLDVTSLIITTRARTTTRTTTTKRQGRAVACKARTQSATVRALLAATLTRSAAPRDRSIPWHHARSLDWCRPSAACFASSAAAVDAPAKPASTTEYESVIGVETHVQLDTNTKAFCSCKNEYGAKPNVNVCPVCLGHPGMLPTLNERVVELAVRTGMALNCEVHQESKFDRKQYFYGDLPKGYQISQNDRPICTDGFVDAPTFVVGTKCDAFPTTRVRINRLHIEEDTAKLTHEGQDSLAGGEGGGGATLADYNRAGVPLVEIVTEPDMRTGEEAAAYAQELRRIVRFLGVSSGNMQEGSLRCDVNVSVRRKGAQELGTKVEVKNLNSFSAVRSAVDFEFRRQTSLLEAGRGSEIKQETRLWDEQRMETKSMRSKEEAADYRYFREPDLPFLALRPGFADQVKAEMPKLPREARDDLLGLGLSVADASILSDDLGLFDYYTECVSSGAEPKQACNWLVGDISALLKEMKRDLDACAMRPQQLAEMCQLIDGGTISGKIAKGLLPELLEKGGSPKELVESKGLVQISDEGELDKIVAEIVESNPKQVEQYRGGKDKLFGFFVGQTMKATKGRANPKMVNDCLRRALDQ